MCGEKNTRNYVEYFLTLGCLPFVHVVLQDVLRVLLSCVFAVLCVYCCFYFRCRTAGYKSDSEGPTTGHLDTGFSWFPCVFKQMLRF